MYQVGFDFALGFRYKQNLDFLFHLFTTIILFIAIPFNSHSSIEYLYVQGER